MLHERHIHYRDYMPFESDPVFMAQMMPDEGLDVWLGQFPKDTVKYTSPLNLALFTSQTATTVITHAQTFANIGMWMERFVIVVPSLSHEFEPWQWTTYMPTWVDWSILLGSFGWFFMWFLLFIRQLPVLALAEIKEIVPPKMGQVARGSRHHQAIEHGGMASAQNNDAGHTDRGVN